jgi:hypothetical protein
MQGGDGVEQERLGGGRHHDVALPGDGRALLVDRHHELERLAPPRQRRAGSADGNRDHAGQGSPSAPIAVGAEDHRCRAVT